MSLDLQSVRRMVCGLWTIFPRSYILPESISKEGDIAFAFGGLAEGCHNGDLYTLQRTGQNQARGGYVLMILHGFIACP